MLQRWTLLLSGLSIALMAGAARACPFCESTTGEQVRALLFNRDFFYHLAVLLMPFAILSLVVGAIYLVEDRS